MRRQNTQNNTIRENTKQKAKYTIERNKLKRNTYNIKQILRK